MAMLLGRYFFFDLFRGDVLRVLLNDSLSDEFSSSCRLEDFLKSVSVNQRRVFSMSLPEDE